MRGKREVEGGKDREGGAQRVVEVEGTDENGAGDRGEAYMARRFV